MKLVLPLSIFVLLFVCLISCNQQAPEAAPPPRPVKINPDPSSAFLTPAQSMSTMQLPAGYHLELVASEPEIQEPVAIVWDGNGNMYVAEMRSYMQDINGTGEHLPVCRITRLEDTDGDGKMDKHTIYIDSLILPRMMLALDDRLVVNETYTYNMYSYRDTNGDGKADEKTLVYHNDKPDDANLEHQKSGLVWNVDNWIYVTSNPVRYRYNNGMLQVDTLYSPPGGQWGLTHDNYGRLFFSSAGGETPALNFQENPVYGELDLDNQLAGDFDEVWPIVGTPDVQGGQQRLRADSTLNHFTASCGQSVYRGDRLPATMKGDLFICEPVGRLIRRAKMIDSNGIVILKNAYDKREFLASTDMNFRPVNTATGPDGCLYIVDMYHGIIQESAWTKPDSYIHPQIKRKQLDLNINRGRIYRLVHDGYKPGPKPQLLNASSGQLVAYLSHPNGWWRDNAQKLLIIHGDQSVVPALKKIATDERSFMERLAFWKKGPSPIARLHALWTLDGLKAVDEKTLLTVLKDDDAEIRKAAIRISEQFLVQQNATVLSKLENLKTDNNYGVRIQLALSLRYSKDPKALAILKELKSSNATNPLLVKAASRSMEEKDESLAELRASTVGMDGEDRDLVFQGAGNFKQLCATCHGMDGKGLATQVAPPLAGSARVNGDKDILLNIVLHGLKGPIDNKKYPDLMVAQKEHTDEYIASVLSYIRNSFGNRQHVVSVDDVKELRATSKDRQTAWTLEELNDWKKNNQKK
jgi:glucose/arabinose dehydrogenase/mono/diheme cytochrome c family protein